MKIVLCIHYLILILPFISSIRRVSDPYYILTLNWPVHRIVKKVFRSLALGLPSSHFVLLLMPTMFIMAMYGSISLLFLKKLIEISKSQGILYRGPYSGLQQQRSQFTSKVNYNRRSILSFDLENQNKMRFDSQSSRKELRHLYTGVWYLTAAICRCVILYAGPSGLFLAFSIGVICGYSSISQFKRIPILGVYLLYPSLFVITSFVVLGVLLPLAQNIHDASEILLRSWKRQSRSSLEKRMLRAMHPIKVFVGPFFYIKKGTKCEYASSVVYYCISLIISSD